VERDLPAGLPGVAAPAAPEPGPGRRRRIGRALAPYGLVGPGGLWLLAFFLIPTVVMLSLSLQTGSVDTGYRLTWHFGEYATAWSLFHTQFFRSLEYAAVATAVTLVVSYPLAYWIAFRGGRFKSTFLFLLLLPFFVSFVIRTVAWKVILADDGVVLGTLKNLHLLPADYHILASTTAVVAGIAYNYLPFMALPLYVSLERIDRRVVEAAKDLYANRRDVFLRVILPLSLPGIFGGVLLTFVPAVGDYVNATILGGVNNTMIGNIIQSQFLENFDYPMAAALSSMLMAAMVIGIYAYARALGTREIQEYV
jgi:spermidine/putrescine transport system permease protein